MCIETPLVFKCESCSLIGIIHKPSITLGQKGVLIVVGGPQYRVGSHRQFVLLARYLSNNGIPVMRFDYRSMGDSEGHDIDFESIRIDIKTAIDQFQLHIPEVKELVIWGLCDAASAALFYAYQDSRVKDLILLNPWVRTESGKAKAYLKHYYSQRILSLDLWKKIFSGDVNIRDSVSSFINTLNNVIVGKSNTDVAEKSLPDRMLYGLERFSGRILLVLSGNNDYVADEFRDVVANSKKWQSLLSEPHVTKHEYTEANHTFSRSDWRKQVEIWTFKWLLEK